MEYVGQMAANWIMGFIAGIFMILLIGLVSLHMFLIYKDMTTFEYIMLKKTLDEKKKLEELPKFEDFRVNTGEKPSS